MTDASVHIRKRIAAYEKKMQRILDTEKKDPVSLNEDQKVLLASKSNIEKFTKELHEILRLTEAAPPPQAQEGVITKDMFASLLGFLAAFGLVYKVAHHEYISPYMPSVLRQSTGQDVAAMLNLYKSIVKLPVSTDDDIIAQIRSLTEASDAPIISDVSYKRMKEIVSSTIEAAVAAKQEAENEASARTPRLGTQALDDRTVDDTSFSVVDNSGLPTDIDATTRADDGNGDDDAGTAIVSTNVPATADASSHRVHRASRSKPQATPEPVEDSEEKVKEWSAGLTQDAHTGVVDIEKEIPAETAEPLKKDHIPQEKAPATADAKTDTAGKDPSRDADDFQLVGRGARSQSNAARHGKASAPSKPRSKSDAPRPQSAAQRSPKPKSAQNGQTQKPKPAHNGQDVKPKPAQNGRDSKPKPAQNGQKNRGRGGPRGQARQQQPQAHAQANGPTVVVADLSALRPPPLRKAI